MNIIEPKVELIKPEGYDLNSIYKMIEIGGRTCYKSEDKITEDSAKKFVEMIKTNSHLSVFEHGTVYLKIPFISDSYGKSWWGKESLYCILPNPDKQFNIVNNEAITASKYFYNKYSKCNIESTFKRCKIIANKHIIEQGKYGELIEFKSCGYKYDDNGIYWEHIAYITTNMRVIIENGWEDDLQYLCEPTKYHEKRYTFRFTTQIAITREANRLWRLNIVIY